MRLVLAILVLSLFAGCLRAPTIPPLGIVSAVGAPLSTEFSGSTPVAQKTGSSSSHNVLGLAAFGDSSVSAAARNGNLKTISFVDYDYLNILGIYQLFTVNAYGE